MSQEIVPVPMQPVYGRSPLYGMFRAWQRAVARYCMMAYFDPNVSLSALFREELAALNTQSQELL